jgi:hypothetical protein
LLWSKFKLKKKKNFLFHPTSLSFFMFYSRDHWKVQLTLFWRDFESFPSFHLPVHTFIRKFVSVRVSNSLWTFKGPPFFYGHGIFRALDPETTCHPDSVLLI